MLWPLLFSKKINGFLATSLLLILTSRGKRTYVIRCFGHYVLNPVPVLPPISWWSPIGWCWLKKIRRIFDFSYFISRLIWIGNSSKTLEMLNLWWTPELVVGDLKLVAKQHQHPRQLQQHQELSSRLVSKHWSDPLLLGFSLQLGTCDSTQVIELYVDTEIVPLVFLT